MKGNVTSTIAALPLRRILAVFPAEQSRRAHGSYGRMAPVERVLA